jgi:hypothetical protein
LAHGGDVNVNLKIFLELVYYMDGLEGESAAFGDGQLFKDYKIKRITIQII